MIIGKGLIANAFANADSDQVVFFASGVSNSLETDLNQFKREENLVLETLHKYPDQVFVYFSTCSIYDSSKYNSPYVLHKLHIEELIKEKAKQFLILRISNAVGNGGNPNLLMNYLYRMIKDQQPISIHQNAKRNLIDVKDVKILTLKFLQNPDKYNKIYNLAFKDNFSTTEIISSFEAILNVNTEKNFFNTGESYSIDVDELDDYFDKTNKTDYLNNLIINYYTN